MPTKPLTLKDLNESQMQRLNTAMKAACIEYGVEFGFELPEEAQVTLARKTIYVFIKENEEAARMANAEKTKHFKSVTTQSGDHDGTE